MSFDNDLDEEFDEQELDEDLDEGEEEKEENDDDPYNMVSEGEFESKTPTTNMISGGNKISVYFMSTIGPGEKKQKLNINDGNLVGDIKETVANLFSLDPTDFYLSSGGVTMDESNRLSYYKVVDGDDILLIPASIAG